MTWQLDAWLRGWPPCVHPDVRTDTDYSGQMFRLRCTKCGKQAAIPIDDLHFKRISVPRLIASLVWT